MATVNTSPEYLDSLQKQADFTSNTLQNSPTAYADNVPASSSDLSLSNKLTGLNKTIDTVRSNQIRNEWYGPQSSQTTTQTGTQADQVPPSSKNWIVSGLSALQKPLNAITGAEQWLLGKGSKPDLFGNINSAMAQGLTAGDVLKQFGVSRAIQIPLGFMLDVFQDPVNWLTAGTEALIPRVGMGFVRGAQEAGLEGGLAAAKEGLISGVARKVAKVLPYNVDAMGNLGERLATTAASTAEATGIEGESKVGNLLTKFSDAYKNFTETVGSKAIASSDAYDALTGTNVYDKLGKNIFGTDFKVGTALEGGIRSLPKGDAIADFFKYSTQDQVKVEKVKDLVSYVAGKTGLVMSHENGVDVVQDISDLLKPGSKITIPGEIANRMKGIVSESTNVGVTKVADTLDNAQKLLDFAGQDASLKNLLEYSPQDLTAAYKASIPGATGVEWYDNLVGGMKSTTMGEVLDKIHAGTLADSMGIYDKVKDWTPFEQIIKANDTMLSLFKVFKVPASLSAHFYAWTGNLTMGWMMGLPISDPEYMRSVMGMKNFLKGNQDALFIRNSFFNEVNSMSDFLENHPNQFRQMSGFSPSAIGEKITAEQKILDRSLQNIPKSATFNEAKKILKEGFDRTDASLANLIEIQKKSELTSDEYQAVNEIKKARINMPSSIETTQTMQKAATGAPLSTSELPSGWGANEVTSNNIMNQWKTNIADGFKSATNPVTKEAYRVANLIMNKMPNMYERIDQSYKLGTTKYLSVIGVPEENLLKISRQVPIEQKDIVNVYTKAGEKLYRLTPQKASEVATETFMNYAAMPDFVKVMRALPIVGSPFLSFSFATAAKAGKTLVNNPSFFNKVAFLMNEVSGTRTPQEKEALKQKYNEYLNSPTVINLGHAFGTDFNTDVKTMLPYLTMNMLNSSQKNYDNSFPSSVVRTIDASPFMKHPIGQLLFDYFIQPAILSGTNQVPEMQFGEPLYPSFDVMGKTITPSLGTKVFYGARQGAEALTPGVASYAGLLGGMLPSGVLNAVPSFGFRQVGNAIQGKNTIGATTKENPIQKTLRALAGRSGISLYPLDTTTTGAKKKP